MERPEVRAEGRRQERPVWQLPRSNEWVSNECASIQRRQPAAVQTCRDRTQRTYRKEEGPVQREESTCRHSDAWCRKSNNRFRRTRGCRRDSRAEIPATERREATGFRRPIATFQGRAPARWQQSTARQRTTRANKDLEAGK